MKKKIVFWFVLLSATVFSACQSGETSTEREDVSVEAPDSTPIVEAENTQGEILQSEVVQEEAVQVEEEQGE